MHVKRKRRKRWKITVFFYEGYREISFSHGSFEVLTKSRLSCYRHHIQISKSLALPKPRNSPKMHRKISWECLVVAQNTTLECTECSLCSPCHWREFTLKIDVTACECDATTLPIDHNPAQDTKMCENAVVSWSGTWGVVFYVVRMWTRCVYSVDVCSRYLCVHVGSVYRVCVSMRELYAAIIDELDVFCMWICVL